MGKFGVVKQILFYSEQPNSSIALTRSEEQLKLKKKTQEYVKKVADSFKEASTGLKAWSAAKNDREGVQKDLFAQIDGASDLTNEQKKNLKAQAKNALGFAPEHSEATYAGIGRATKDELIYLEGRILAADEGKSTMEREIAKTKT